MKKIILTILFMFSCNTLAKTDSQMNGDSKGYMPNIEFSGYLEIVTEFINNFDSPSTSDVYLSEANLNAKSQLNKKIKAEIQFFHADRYADLRLDEGFLTYKASGSINIHAGRYQIPFGEYDSGLAYSSYVKAIGKSKQDAVGFELNQGLFRFSAYAFNGEGETSVEGDKIDSYGAEIRFEQPKWLLAVGYVNNLNDSVRLVGKVTTNNKYVDASVVTLKYKFDNGFKIYGEYITSFSKFAQQDLAFKNQGAQVSAYQSEVSYTREMFGKEMTIAASFQKSKESNALSIAETRFTFGVSRELVQDTVLYCEFFHDDDYDVADGGTGKSGNSFAALLAHSF
jgi:hypothetical protein